MYRQFLVTEGDPEWEAHNATYLSLLLTLADVPEKKALPHYPAPHERAYAWQRLGSVPQVMSKCLNKHSKAVLWKRGGPFPGKLPPALATLILLPISGSLNL